MLKPIFIQTPQENIMSYVTFHDGEEKNKRAACAVLLTAGDLDANGNLIRADISYIEMPLPELPESLQEILKEDLIGIKEDSIVIMRLFEKIGDDYVPMFLHDKKETEDANG